MKNKSYIILVLFFFVLISQFSYSQNTKLSVDDQLLQRSIYEDTKLKVLNYSMKEFNSLFEEFFQKKLNPDMLLTKEEFYGYTVQIAAFSDRLAALYPEEKQVAEDNKKKWLSENYQDYLVFKKSQKK